LPTVIGIPASVKVLSPSVCLPLFALMLGLIFFFQAEAGIRDATVTGVQTCALPILQLPRKERTDGARATFPSTERGITHSDRFRSEERRVGKEGRARRAGDGSRRHTGTRPGESTAHVRTAVRRCHAQVSRRPYAYQA